MIIPCPPSLNPLRVLKAALYCAWRASHHIRDHHAPNLEYMEELWEEASRASDAACSAQMKEGWVYANILGDCKIRMGLRVVPDEHAVELAPDNPSIKHQPWVETYKDYPSLMRAACEVLGYEATHTPEDMKKPQLLQVVQHPAKELQIRPSFLS